MMAVTSGSVALSTTATQISSATDTDRVRGESVFINNTSAVTIYLGGSGVTTATGYPLAAGATLRVDLPTDDALYAIAGSSVNIIVMNVGV